MTKKKEAEAILTLQKLYVSDSAQKLNTLREFLTKGLLAILIFLVLFSLESFPVSAEFIKANITASIQQDYYASGIVSGWINISLKNERLDSQLSTSFNYSITLSNILQENNLLGKVTCKSSLCNSTFLKIQLEPAGFKVPSEYGNHTLVLYLNGNEIAMQNITISLIPKINSILPSIVPAAVSVDFSVSVLPVSNSTIAEYEWNFGDGSASVKTTVNIATHAYSSAGEYALKISVKDSQNRRASREFQVSAVSPKEFANETINEKKRTLQNISNAILAYPEWRRDFISAQLNITGIDAQLNALQQDYNSATTIQQYVDVMNKLASMKVPERLSGVIASNIRFYVVPESIGMEKLKDAGAGNYNANKASEYKNAIALWFAEKIDATLSSEVISAEFDTGDAGEIATYIKISIKPKEALKDIYLVISKPQVGIKFKDASGKSLGAEATALTLSGLSTNVKKDMEFMVSEGMQIDDIFNSVYISPKLSELNLELQIEPCNSNRVCEKELGETFGNCKPDCGKPAWLVILFIILVLAGAFIVYIILQEWYKSHYENSLFKNKNDLYNLLAFIDNAKKQGINEADMARKLREKGWSGEQISYAMKKYKGQRIGMWEIPLFKGMENKKVKQEIAKRAANQSQSYMYQKR